MDPEAAETAEAGRTRSLPTKGSAPDMTREQHLQELFTKIDTDGDGKLTEKEISRKLQMDGELQEILSTSVSASQIGRGMLAVVPSPSLARARAQKVIAALDTDGDGTLSRDEFVQLVTELGTPVEQLPPGSRARQALERANLQI